MNTENLKEELQKHVVMLAQNIGERNYLAYENLRKSAEYILNEFKNYRLNIKVQEFKYLGKKFQNIIGGQEQKQDSVIIVGAHYDTVVGSPGACDNASGIAMLLVLAKIFAKKIGDLHGIEFVAFTNEEPPFFQTPAMGSMIFAKQAKKEKAAIKAMLCFESVGYFSDRPNSQNYPFGLSFFYPNKGDFIAVVGNIQSQDLLKKTVKNLKLQTDLKVESLIGFNFIAGVDFSDHASFWKYGYPAVMLTDTAFYRYPFYHSEHDTQEKIDYGMLSKLTYALESLISDLANN